MSVSEKFIDLVGVDRDEIEHLGPVLFAQTCGTKEDQFRATMQKKLPLGAHTGVIIWTVSGGYENQNMWLFPVNPPLRVTLIMVQ